MTAPAPPTTIGPADAPGAAAETRTPSRRTRGSAVRIAGPALVFAAAMGIWILVSTVLLDPANRFLLPAPQDVVREGLLDPYARTELLIALGSTVRVALTGLAIAIALGVLAAVVMSQARWLEQSLYPYAVVLQTIPILAVVPMFGFWFGYEFPSRVIVCVMIALFPIITNTLFGLKSADAGLHDLFTLHGANRAQRLLRLQLPAALPAMVTGFKISAGMAIIGSIVADFFFRQGEAGIGRMIDVYRQRLATDELVTALILSSLAGLLLFWFFDLIGTRIDRCRSGR